jgi:hypothetical protein
LPHIPPSLERTLLQLTIAIGGFVPVCGGLLGAILGDAMTGEIAFAPSLDSHVRYLSGLLLGIGLAFWEAIPQIERHTARIRLLTAIVALGGLVRLVGLVAVARPDRVMQSAVVMELVVTPLICLWQARVARQQAALASSPDV